MLKHVIERAAALLAEPGVTAVLGLRAGEEGTAPWFFTTAGELADLTLEPKWPLAKTAWRAAREMPAGESLGLVGRGCDLRALAELEKAGQLRPGAVRAAPVPCSAEQGAACLCPTPWPPGGEVAPGVEFLTDAATASLLRDADRADRWREHFSRCIKCYGCRNACPLCTCPECKLEEDGYVAQGRIPPEPLAFHLIRAMHLADRCVGCGACQEACPAGLPLLALHQWLRRSLQEGFGYASGGVAPSPVFAAAREDGVLGAPEPAWEDTRQGGGTGAAHGR
jgi:ferredoxin